MLCPSTGRAAQWLLAALCCMLAEFTGAKDSEWQWHQLGHTQICNSTQTDNHASTHHSVFTG